MFRPINYVKMANYRIYITFRTHIRTVQFYLRQGLYNSLILIGDFENVLRIYFFKLFHSSEKNLISHAAKFSLIFLSHSDMNYIFVPIHQLIGNYILALSICGRISDPSRTFRTTTDSVLCPVNRSSLRSKSFNRPGAVVFFSTRESD